MLDRRTEKTLSRALELSHTGNWTRALKAFESALRSEPENPQLWLERGKVLQRLGRYPEALESFDRALGLAPQHADAWYNRGLALTKLGRNQEALNAFQQARQFGSEMTPEESEVPMDLFLRGAAGERAEPDEPRASDREEVYVARKNGFRLDLKFTWDDGGEDRLIVRRLSETTIEAVSSRYPSCSVTIESQARVPCDYPAKALAEDLAAESAGPMGHKHLYVFPNGLLPACAVRKSQPNGGAILEDIVVSGRFAYRLRRVTIQDGVNEDEEFSRRILTHFHPLADAGTSP